MSRHFGFMFRPENAAIMYIIGKSRAIDSAKEKVELGKIVANKRAELEKLPPLPYRFVAFDK